jgi:hypothetical protein
MTEQEMWLCRIYNSRGYGLPEEVWAKFKLFCEANNLTAEPPPGRHIDGADTWDALVTK